MLQSQIKLKYLFHKLEVLKMDKMSLETFKIDEIGRNEQVLSQKMTNIDQLIESRKKRIESLSMIKSNLKSIHTKLSKL